MSDKQKNLSNDEMPNKANSSTKLQDDIKNGTIPEAPKDTNKALTAQETQLMIQKSGTLIHTLLEMLRSTQTVIIAGASPDAADLPADVSTFLNK